MKINKLILSALLVANIAFANDELKAYTNIKYRVNYDNLEEDKKKKIAEEYEKLSNLSIKLQKKQLKSDVDFKVLTNIQAVDVWAKNFLKEYKPTDKEIEEIYKSNKFTIPEKYNIRNILVNDEKTADNIIKSLNISDKQKKLDKFILSVKEQSLDLQSRKKDGLSGWLEINKINPTVLNALKGKKIGDIVKVNIKNIGWQIVMIEDYQSKREAKAEEIKDLLIKKAKQKALNLEIEKLYQEK